MQVVKDLEDREKNVVRKLANYKDLRFEAKDDVNSLSIGDDAWVLSDAALKILAEDLNIPNPYLRRCPSDVSNYTINYFLQERKDTQTSLLIDTEEEIVRSFMSPQYPYVPTKKIYDIMSKTLGEVQIHNSSIDTDIVELITFAPRFDQSIVDSPVKAGIRMLYSDSWSIAPKFDSYLCRIECFNSAIAPIMNRKFRMANKSENEILEQTKMFVEQSVKQIPIMLKGFEDLNNQKVDNWTSLVRRICVENQLPHKLCEKLIIYADKPQFKATVTNKKIATMYDVINLFTYVGTHDTMITPEQREHLFSIAGNCMLTKSTRCVSCGGSV
jgi:hypothetical protein